MSFFDAQPAGRLLNRFSKDTEAADILLRENLAYWISETCASLFLDAGASHKSCALRLRKATEYTARVPLTKGFQST